MGHQFKIAQDEDEEFVRIWDNDMASIEDQVLKPELCVSDLHSEICNCNNSTAC